VQGFVAINKPEGITSFGVVYLLRKMTQVKKVGHAGTLDPFASGVLIVAVGKAFTRQISHWMNTPKTYQVRCVLGIQTDTLDAFGKINSMQPITVTQQQVLDVLPQFVGEQWQTPPIFSAKKIEGKKLYDYARKGEEVAIAPHLVTVHELRLLNFFQHEFPIIDLEIKCSKGTYVRSLIRDIAAKLGTVGYAKNLIRTAIGDVTLSRSVSLSDADSIRQSFFTLA